MATHLASFRGSNHRFDSFSRSGVMVGILVSVFALLCLNACLAASKTPSKKAPILPGQRPQLPPPATKELPPGQIVREPLKAIEQGRQIFCYDTFGDEDFWGGTLRLHEAVAKLPPTKVLELGLKVDSEVLPPPVVRELKAGKLNLNDPAVSLNLHTWTGWGSVPYWNAFVANLEMRGKGVFHDPRLNDKKFPVSAAHPDLFGEKKDATDLITSKLPALHVYQLSLTPPVPPKGTFDPAAALRGRTLFSGKARCNSCHVPPIFTDPGFNMHTPEEIGIDDFQANRSPSERYRYRTAPLGGLWSHQKGGFYHDGRFATLMDVVNHYVSVLKLDLTDAEKQDLVQYLLSLPADLGPQG